MLQVSNMMISVVHHLGMLEHDLDIRRLVTNMSRQMLIGLCGFCQRAAESFVINFQILDSKKHFLGKLHTRLGWVKTAKHVDF